MYAIALDPSNPRTIYAGSTNGAYKSTDGGRTWAAINTGLTTLWVESLAIDPTSRQTLYAGSGGGAGGGVYKSVDGGATWSGTSLRAGWVYSLAVNPTDTQNIFAGVNHKGHRGVMVSSDGGGTWALENDGMGSEQVNVLAVDPSGTLVHAAAYPGVWELTLP